MTAKNFYWIEDKTQPCGWKICLKNMFGKTVEVNMEQAQSILGHPDSPLINVPLNVDADIVRAAINGRPDGIHYYPCG